MRITLLLSFFNLCLIYHVDAQVAYTPFDFETSIWHESSYSNWFLKSDYINKIEGDTIINGVDYYKLRKIGKTFLYEDVSQTEIADTIEIDEYVGSIRENAEKQIEFIKAASELPEILYDFNLNIGDTVAFDDNDVGLLKAEVISIDTIEICGIQRNSYSIKLIEYPTVVSHLIEGIGSTAGLLPGFEYFESGTFFTCYSNQDCICNEIQVGINVENKEGPEIKIYPNPVLGEKLVMIQEGTIRELNIQVYNEIGQLIYSIKKNTKRTKIDCSNWSKGVYFININLKGNQIVQKVVKQ